jgi:hypothetical protein
MTFVGLGGRVEHRDYSTGWARRNAAARGGVPFRVQWGKSNFRGDERGMLTKADKWHAFYLGLLYLAAAEALSRWTASFPFCLLPAQAAAEGEGAGQGCATFHEGVVFAWQRASVFARQQAAPFIAANHDAIVAVALALIALFVLGLWRSLSRLLHANQRQLERAAGAAAEQAAFIARSVAAAADAAAASRRHAVTAERALEELERPYLFVFGVKYLKIDAERAGELEPFVEYTVANYGKTPAIVENIGAGFEAANGAEAPAPFQVEDANPLVVAPILAPQEKRGPVKHYYPTDGSVPDFKFIGSGAFSSFAVLETKANEDILFRVVIEYRGPSGNAHKTGACWAYDKLTDTFLARGGKADNFLE